jgi:hypothetical protein
MAQAKGIQGLVEEGVCFMTLIISFIPSKLLCNGEPIIGTNIHALLNLLKLALDKDISEIQVFGDPKLVIEWMNGSYRIENITMGPLLDQVMVAAAHFDEISFTHVKRRFNFVVDDLSKEAVFGQQGSVLVEDHREGGSSFCALNLFPWSLSLTDCCRK